MGGAARFILGLVDKIRHPVDPVVGGPAAAGTAARAAAAATTGRRRTETGLLIEENVGVLVDDLLLANLLGVRIVEGVPLTVRGVLTGGGVVPAKDVGPVVVAN